MDRDRWYRTPFSDNSRTNEPITSSHRQIITNHEKQSGKKTAAERHSNRQQAEIGFWVAMAPQERTGAVAIEQQQ
jgi:hypothetical protein